jgi:hypothetical protein
MLEIQARSAGRPDTVRRRVSLVDAEVQVPLHLILGIGGCERFDDAH